MQVVVEFNIINCFASIFHLISLKVVKVLLSCFRILIELVVDSESVLSNSDCESVSSFFCKLAGSEYAFASGKTVLDSRGLPRVSAGKSVARL